MELTVDQALQQGVAAHKEGKLQDAERLYRAILEAQPSHPDANHNLGALAVAVGKPLEAIPLFKLALEANPKVEQFWLSYIDVLMRLERFDEAKRVLVAGEEYGVSQEKLETLNQRPQVSVLNNPNEIVKNQTLSEKRKTLGEKKKSKKREAQDFSSNTAPSQNQISQLLGHYQAGRLEEAEALATSLTQLFPKHPFGWKVLGAVFKQAGRLSESLAAKQQSAELSPQDPEAHNNLGSTLKELGRLAEAEASCRQAIALRPDYAEAYNNLGNTLASAGRLEEAEKNILRALELNPNYAVAHNNLGVLLTEVGRLSEAERNLKRAIELKPEYAEAHCNLGDALRYGGKLDEARACLTRGLGLDPSMGVAHNTLGVTLTELGDVAAAVDSFIQAMNLKPNYAEPRWNLVGCEATIQGAEYWIDECLIVAPNHEKAKLTKAALRFYQGETSDFESLKQSVFVRHPFMRSYDWVFSLPKRPELHFNRWCFFDSVIEKSLSTRPFYEFGVWRGQAFRYLMKTFKKGFGFDTFTGLPEDWVIGKKLESAGTYTSDGLVPEIEGGEFIVGRFEDTLPAFFSAPRPTASLINFDADLYSSTICALRFSTPVIDESTVLVFDEFLMNESWEHDEYRALNEFCRDQDCEYDVLAVSFFTKQVAVRLIGI